MLETWRLPAVTSPMKMVPDWEPRLTAPVVVMADAESTVTPPEPAVTVIKTLPDPVRIEPVLVVDIEPPEVVAVKLPLPADALMVALMLIVPAASRVKLLSVVQVIPS